MREDVDKLRWHFPSSGRWKINCDGSYKPDAAAIGLVCRNDEGSYLWAFGETVEADSAVVTEVLAVKNALCLLQVFEDRKFIIDTDCSEVSWCCKKNSADGIDWRGRWDMEEVISTLNRLSDEEITLISRKGNKAADWIAVNCGRGLCPYGWVETPSPPLALILENDIKVGRRSAGCEENDLAEDAERCGVG